MTGLEPVTSSLPRKCSTAELHWQRRAEDEVRTRDPQLGRLMLYQLSYFRDRKVGADGFEPPKVETSRFTVCPIWPLWYTPKTFQITSFFEPLVGFEPTTPRLQITCSGQLS